MNHSILTRTLATTMALTFAAAPFALSTAFAADASDGTAMKSDHPVNDTWITTKVKAELATTDGVKSTDIDVKTVDGVVMLTGTVGTKLAAEKAVAAAQSVKGVKKVDHSGLKSQQ